MSNSVQPHRRQPTRLPCPWDSPGENTRVGCHFLLQCMKVKSEREIAQSCLTLSDPMDCSLPGPSNPWDFPGKSTGVGCHCLLRRSSEMSAYLSASSLQQKMLPFGKGEVGFWQGGDLTKNLLLNMLGLSFLLDIQVVIPSETFE